MKAGAAYQFGLGAMTRLRSSETSSILQEGMETA